VKPEAYVYWLHIKRKKTQEQNTINKGKLKKPTSWRKYRARHNI
jgi:hypothetical protein